MDTILRKSLADEGFEICHPFHSDWYNAKIQKEGLQKQLEELPEDAGLSFLVGNTSSLWPLFCQWLVKHYQVENKISEEEALKAVISMENPLDTFVEERLSAALKTFGKESGNQQNYEIYWAHGGRKFCRGGGLADYKDEVNPPDTSFLVCMSRIAELSGLCWNDQDGTKLCVHPTYGTWYALRAVIIFDPRVYQFNLLRRKAPQPLECPVDPKEIEIAKEQMQVAIRASAEDGSGVDHGKDNINETGKSLCKYLHHSVCDGTEWDKVSPSMKAWIKLRDCISLGRDEHRYGNAQLLYHYTKDPEILRNEVKRCLEQNQ